MSSKDETSLSIFVCSCLYFYQFGLSKEVSEHFPVRLAGLRGQVTAALLKRMPMGWSHAPRIAQAVSNYIMQDLGFAWVDNFILGDVTKEGLEERKKLLRERLHRYKIEVDDNTCTCLIALVSSENDTFSCYRFFSL